MTSRLDWARKAEELRREAPRTADIMRKEANAIEEMLRLFTCNECNALIDVPSSNQYGRALMTHQLGCPCA